MDTVRAFAAQAASWIVGDPSAEGLHARTNLTYEELHAEVQSILIPANLPKGVGLHVLQPLSKTFALTHRRGGRGMGGMGWMEAPSLRHCDPTHTHTMTTSHLETRTLHTIPAPIQNPVGERQAGGEPVCGHDGRRRRRGAEGRVRATEALPTLRSRRGVYSGVPRCAWGRWDTRR